MSTNAAVSSNTRATRSRFSSPQVATNGTADSLSSSRTQGNGSATNGTEGQKTFMQRWLEPPVQVKASYQDAGLVRQGVFENMAPLGTLPKVGVFKKTAPPPPAAPERAPVRIVVKQKPKLPSAPVPAPPPPAPEEDETEEDETEDEDDGKTVEDPDDDEDQDAAAIKEESKARTTVASRRSRRSVTSGATDDEEWAPGSSAQNGRTRRSVSRASTVPSQQPAADASAVSQPISLKEFVGHVVEAAVDEAVTHFRYPTAWALRTLYDENSSNQEILTMIQKVFLQTATADELEEFARCIQSRKKEGEKDNKAFRHFVPDSADGDSAPHPPKKAPYGNLLQFDLSTLRLNQEAGKSLKKERSAQAAEPEPEVQPEQNAEPEPEQPPRKKRKSTRQQPEAAPSSTTKMTANGVNGKAIAETPSRRRTRARSVSSTSSLSSARSMTPPDGIQEDQEEEGFDETPSRTSPVPSQPITANKRRRSNAPRKSRNVSPSRPSPAPSTTANSAPQQQAAAATPAQSQRQSPAADAEQQPYEMPAVVDSPLFPNLNSKKGSKSGTPNLVIATKVGKLDPDDPKLRLRQKARELTNTPLPVSDAREPSPRLASQQEELVEPVRPTTPAPTLASRSRVTLPSARATPAPREGRSTRASLKRTHDDLEDQPSPTTFNFPGSEAASTAANSRAGTPALRAAKKPRTGLRVKNSPMKKKNGPSAGIPRPSGERSSPIGNVIREDDNDDYCSSCGGNGELICCDGCTRSFHFSCVDPVLRADDMPVEWFCNVCRVNRDPAHLPTHNGAFALLMEKLDARNSSAFRLPRPVRDRFEGVRTGADGEYEEITNYVKPARKKKNDEEPKYDYWRIRDDDGNAIICHACQETSAPDRATVPCSVCGIFWHLDCLDPPHPYPPSLRTWKCPLHTENLLASLPGSLYPAHRHRKVKDAPVIKPSFSRGYVNNGYVEVDLDDSEDESGWKDFETFGRTVRLSEKGIKLDFLSRVRGVPRAELAASAAAQPVSRPLAERSLEEQQAALNLAQLGTSNHKGGFGALIDALISNATPSAIDIMARADPTHLRDSNLNQVDQQSLRAMLANAESITEHIRNILASRASAQPSTQAVAAATELEEGPAAVPSLTNSQSPDPESDNSANLDADPSAMELDDAAKSPPSPATTDDVPAMTQGEKTPVQGDQSPAAPLPLEKSVPVIEDGGVPATPTKAAVLPGDEPVVLEEGGDGEKTLGEGGAIEME